MKVDYKVDKIPETRGRARKSRAYDVMYNFLTSSNTVVRICEFKDKRELERFYRSANNDARKQPEFATIKIYMRGDAVYLKKTEAQE